MTHSKLALNVDFTQIRSLEGRQDVAFEEFCCQMARRVKEIPFGSKYLRFRGAGGDGGVECLWVLPNGEKWGWQAKYFFNLTRGKRQLDKSVKTALEIHPELTRYTIQQVVREKAKRKNSRTTNRNGIHLLRAKA
jgi:hypothetical protein